MDQDKTIRRTFTGTASRDAADKTVPVLVERIMVHPKYGKRIKRSRTFLVHDEKNRTRAGDAVTFVECRPLSARKRWRVTSGS